MCERLCRGLLHQPPIQRLKNSVWVFLLFSLCITPARAQWTGKVSTRELTRAELLGKIKPWNHKDDFVKIPRKHANNDRHWIRREVWEAYEAMRKDAHKEGIVLMVVSSFRRWRHQNLIWYNKWNGRIPVRGRNLKEEVPNTWERTEIILRYSAMPGTSRHHWGTELDFNRVFNPYFEEDYGAKVYDWLKENAHKYGFCQPYTEHSDYRPEGVWEEKWHWSYAPLSVNFLRQYAEKITYKDIQGFPGASLADDFDILRKYVEGVDPGCIDPSMLQKPTASQALRPDNQMKTR